MLTPFWFGLWDWIGYSKVNATVSDSDNGALLKRAQAREAKLGEFDQELKLSSTALEKDYEESQKHKCEAAEVK